MIPVTPLRALLLVPREAPDVLMVLLFLSSTDHLGSFGSIGSCIWGAVQRISLAQETVVGSFCSFYICCRGLGSLPVSTVDRLCRWGVWQQARDGNGYPLPLTELCTSLDLWQPLAYTHHH